ncbi:hypothetical protein OsJ_28808 [Oryza sativa Japonica Group]|uniref:Uncharacterized protein n=1 Tax=Oryza sativa subsp. japonica TaxID=39947 RepID=B9G2S8_ORYSJ|nr:hypothetical protein OsJ_33458 [Oryza sativa Japonica Group]EEE69425.1 hypothetical protein OsJ_28808 [Oryza sativa Japonica Group]
MDLQHLLKSDKLFSTILLQGELKDITTEIKYGAYHKRLRHLVGADGKPGSSRAEAPALGTEEEILALLLFGGGRVHSSARQSGGVVAVDKPADPRTEYRGGMLATAAS